MRSKCPPTLLFVLVPARRGLRRNPTSRWCQRSLSQLWGPMKTCNPKEVVIFHQGQRCLASATVLQVPPRIVVFSRLKNSCIIFIREKISFNAQSTGCRFLISTWPVQRKLDRTGQRQFLSLKWLLNLSSYFHSFINQPKLFSSLNNTLIFIRSFCFSQI